MTTALVTTVSLVGALVALLGSASTLARRRIGLVHLGAAGLLETLLVLQTVLALAGLAGGHRLTETATFLGYLLTVLLIPPAGALWARSDPTRWGGTVLAVAALVVTVMDWRLLQLWTAPGA